MSTAVDGCWRSVGQNNNIVINKIKYEDFC
jgi:hypothetical protein